MQYLLVKYIATLLSPSGSVDALKSVVGYTSDELSILLILFAIKFTETIYSNQSQERRFGFSVDHFKSMKNDFSPDNSLVSLICDATILVVSNRKFSPNGNGFAFAEVFVVNDVSVPLGLVADVDLTVE